MNEYSCQSWDAETQSWVLNIVDHFDTLEDAIKFGKEVYTEFRVINKGTIEYVRVYQDGVLLEHPRWCDAGTSLAFIKGLNVSKDLERQLKDAQRHARNRAKVLEGIYGHLQGVNMALERIQYVTEILELDKLSEDIKQQRSILTTQIKKVDHLSYEP